MLIKLSNQTYINPDKITCIIERPHYGEAQAYWVVTFDGENNLVLSQAHFDELMACLPEPRDAITMAEARKASDRWKEIMERRDREKAEEASRD